MATSGTSGISRCNDEGCINGVHVRTCRKCAGNPPRYHISRKPMVYTGEPIQLTGLRGNGECEACLGRGSTVTPCGGRGEMVSFQRGPPNSAADGRPPSARHGPGANGGIKVIR